MGFAEELNRFGAKANILRGVPLLFGRDENLLDKVGDFRIDWSESGPNIHHTPGYGPCWGQTIQAFDPNGVKHTAVQTPKGWVNKNGHLYLLTASWTEPEPGHASWACQLTQEEYSKILEVISWLKRNGGDAYGEALPEWHLSAPNWSNPSRTPDRKGLEEVLDEISIQSRYDETEPPGAFYGGECEFFSPKPVISTEEADQIKLEVFINGSSAFEFAGYLGGSSSPRYVATCLMNIYGELCGDKQDMAILEKIEEALRDLQETTPKREQ